MIPLGKVYATGDEMAEIEKVINSGWWAGSGPATRRLEEMVAEYLDLPNGYKVCAVSNCTIALALCLEYLDVMGGEVIVPSYSFVATAFSVSHAGAKPVFADIGEDHLNLDVQSAEDRINGSTQAIMPVHQYGVPFDIDGFTKLTDKEELYIVEDAACAFGSEYKGKYIGNFGNLTCFSLHARKTLTSGEGGLIIIPPEHDASWFYSMRQFGVDKSPFERHGVKGYHEAVYSRLGYNMKMSDIQSAVAIAQLKNYDKILDMRRNVAGTYNDKLSQIEELELMKVPENCESSWQNYRILVNEQDDRNDLLNHLREKEIMAKTCIQPIHLEPVYRDDDDCCEITRHVSDCGIWLPFYPQMADDEINTVADAIKEYFDA